MLTNSSSPSPFAFLQHIQGCHRGDKLKHISKLKQYLHNTNFHKSSSSPNHSNDNYLDHLLQKAIKTYQTNYHLNASGALDSDTVDTMMSPRCGVADIVNATNWMQSHHHHRHETATIGSLHTVCHFTFFQGNPNWKSSRLTYGFLQGTPLIAMEQVSKAFLTWSQNTHFKFHRASAGNRPDIMVSFHRGDHGDGAPFERKGGTIAQAFAPENGRFHYDADEPWGVGNHRAFDLETVALHEIGHLLGLGHSSVEGATMYPTIAIGATKGLHRDDIQGIKSLYY
ncbi:Metalloendoproteinase 2-MMP [Linum perenne]